MYYRLKDDAQSFGTNDKLRFSKKNPCDAFLFKTPHFYALELKSVASNSISFERSKEEKGVIHYHQITSLEKFSTYENCVAGFVLNFRTDNHTYFINIKDFDTMISELDKKSFNESDLLKYNPILIEQTLKKVNYKYNVGKFLQETKL